jgi:hypothetical protein
VLWNKEKEGYKDVKNTLLSFEYILVESSLFGMRNKVLDVEDQDNLPLSHLRTTCKPLS